MSLLRVLWKQAERVGEEKNGLRQGGNGAQVEIRAAARYFALYPIAVGRVPLLVYLPFTPGAQGGASLENRVAFPLSTRLAMRQREEWSFYCCAMNAAPI